MNGFCIDRCVVDPGPLVNRCRIFLLVVRGMLFCIFVCRVVVLI